MTAININVTVSLADEDRERIDTLVSAMTGAVTETVEAEAPAKKAPAKKAAAKKPPAKKAAAKKVKEPEVGPLDDGDTPTKEDVRAALSEYREIEGTEALKDVLKEFDTTSLDGLDEADYAKIIAHVQ